MKNTGLHTKLGKTLHSMASQFATADMRAIMEASARGAKEAGGKTIGVTFKNNSKRV